MIFPKLFKCDDEIHEKWLSASRILVFTLLIALGFGFVIFNWFYKFIPPIWVNMSKPQPSILDIGRDVYIASFAVVAYYVFTKYKKRSISEKFSILLILSSLLVIAVVALIFIIIVGIICRYGF
jgi:hypothetical protein